MNLPTKVVENLTAPSGSIKIYRYKEPFMPNPEPYFGFQGVLLHDSVLPLIQCSVCGEWYGALTGPHLKTHKLDSTSYKEKFGLAKSTALINESLRERFIASALKTQNYKKVKNPKPFKKGHKQKKTYFGSSMETKNNNGTCPEQILDRLKKFKQKLGHQPSYHEAKKKFRGLTDSAVRTYGSWRNVCELLGWKVLKPGLSFGKFSWDKETLIKVLVMFKKEHKREPTGSDVRRGLIPAIPNFYHHFGKKGFAVAKEIAYGRQENI